MPFTKVAAISVVTEELLRFSSPSADRLVRDGLAGAVIARLDIDFIDPGKAAVANVSPASITERRHADRPDRDRRCRRHPQGPPRADGLRSSRRTTRRPRPFTS
jgi:hypothetical protein